MTAYTRPIALFVLLFFTIGTAMPMGNMMQLQQSLSIITQETNNSHCSDAPADSNSEKNSCCSVSCKLCLSNAIITPGTIVTASTWQYRYFKPSNTNALSLYEAPLKRPPIGA